jgi:heterodisulfide reductase subunit D
MILLCPGCLRTFNDYFIPRKANPLKKVYHYTELMEQNLDKIQFDTKKRVRTKRVTYHDPCHLGRHLGLFEPPRVILNHIPKVEFVEMPTAHEGSFCCGSGGGLRAYNKDLADYASALRLKEAKSIDADCLITSCPFCERSFKAAQESDKETRGLKVFNLAVFAAQYMKD